MESINVIIYLLHARKKEDYILLYSFPLPTLCLKLKLNTARYFINRIHGQPVVIHEKHSSSTTFTSYSRILY